MNQEREQYLVTEQGRSEYLPRVFLDKVCRFSMLCETQRMGAWASDVEAPSHSDSAFAYIGWKVTIPCDYNALLALHQLRHAASFSEPVGESCMLAEVKGAASRASKKLLQI